MFKWVNICIIECAKGNTKNMESKKTYLSCRIINCADRIGLENNSMYMRILWCLLEDIIKPLKSYRIILKHRLKVKAIITTFRKGTIEITWCILIEA